MKIEFPKVIEGVDLKDYAKEFDVSLMVWVNPPRKLAHELAKALSGKDTAELIRVLVEIWSQGEPETRWTVDELNAFIDSLDDTDPALFAWMISKTMEAISAHRMGRKKKVSAPLSS